MHNISPTTGVYYLDMVSSRIHCSHVIIYNAEPRFGLCSDPSIGKKRSRRSYKASMTSLLEHSFAHPAAYNFFQKKSTDHFFYLTCSDLSKLGLIFFNSYSQNQNPIQKLFDNIKLLSKNLYCTPKVRSCYKTFNVVGNTFCLRRHQSQCNWGGWSAILGIEAWILSTCIN